MIDENQYQALCDECDKIISSGSGDEKIVSVSWLHVIREHPVFLQYYYDLFNKNISRHKHNVKLQKKKLLYLLKGFAHIIRTLFSRGRHFYVSNTIPSRFDFLFISHFLQDADAGSENDFYFGRLISSLEEKGFSVVIALINYTKIPEKKLASKWVLAKSPRIIFSRSTSLFSELHSFASILKISEHIKRVGNKVSKNSFSSLFCKYAATEALAGSSFTNLRRFKQLKYFLRYHSPSSVVFTCEGHAWERMAIYAAKSSNKAITVIGYQHAALFRLQHSLSRSLGINFDPDMILVPGQRSLNILEDKIGLGKTKLAIVGSDRGGKVGVAYSFPYDNFGIDSPIDVLVAPEGIVSECLILFNYALEQASKYPDINFYFQLHPIIDKKWFIKKNTLYQLLPKNIKWSPSGGALSSKVYSHIIYRGTTMVINASINGIQPIYYKADEQEMSIDLLDDNVGFKLSVSHSTPNLLEIILNYRKKTLEQMLDEYELVKKYCFDFYSPLNYEVLPHVLD